MKVFLIATTAVMAGLVLAPNAAAQSLYNLETLDEEFRSSKPSWYNGELSQEGWVRNQNLILELVPYEWRVYEREGYRDLQNALTDAETKCFNSGDLMAEEAAQKRYGEYISAFKALYQIYINEDTPPDVKAAFEAEYLDTDKRPKLLKGCPPRQTLRTAKEIGIPTFSQISRKKLSDHLRTTIFSGLSSQNTPRSGYGFRSTGAGETYAGLSDSRLSGVRFSIAMAEIREAFPETEGSDDLTWYDEWDHDDYEEDWMFGASYESLNGTATGRVENGTDNTGIVYHDRAPNDSTGVAIGNRGLDVSIDTDFESFEFYGQKHIKTNGAIKPYVGLNMIFSDTTHEAQISTPSFSDISSTSLQKIDNDLIAAVLGGQTKYHFSDKLSLSANAEVSLGGLFSKLDSVQTNRCGLCAPEEQNFSVAIEDKRETLAVGAKGSMAILLEILEGAHVGPRGFVEWRNKEGYPRNPQSGDDLFIDNNPTHLEFDDKFSYGGGLEAIFTF